METWRLNLALAAACAAAEDDDWCTRPAPVWAGSDDEGTEG